MENFESFLLNRLLENGKSEGIYLRLRLEVDWVRVKFGWLLISIIGFDVVI